ncbi:sugar phosphate isomerase/epimerase [Pedobacter changchengzhani]|uniref:Sugar phosphate isomerase/epimerase n=1 Tax=Pedobacter changchengzhani TaxID=2529274 RepID=A0A4R5MKH8_9SPHI|nr:TIM barrel protein [Pedobacter changchengzhani]TDG36170.1 sugar phosphate isomerase/epimerase [Pedobacter changchengzhani]
MPKVKFYCPRWGAEDLDWDVFLEKVISSGYDGVEVYPLLTPEEKPAMLQALEETSLDFSLLHTVQNEGKDFAKYCEALERNLNELITYQTETIKPKFITSQTGREYFTKDQMEICFAICDRISAESGIQIFHELHRNKWSYAAHVVKSYLEDERFDEVKLTLDFSHWVCVSESYLEDQQEAIDLAIKRAVHIHARVGHIEGPQVTDPRTLENKEALNFHLLWWDKWMEHLKSSGIKECSITPEFGSYPYMAHQIGTTTPIASQWEINCWMKDLLKERYC